MSTFLSARRRSWTRILLVLLLFQAYVPAGFMPASGTPFLVELCPAAGPMTMSMPMMAHHHHHSGSTHDQFESCPFGSAPAVGPMAQFIVFAPSAPIVSALFGVKESPRLGVRFERAHPPRGPPLLLA